MNTKIYFKFTSCNEAGVEAKDSYIYKEGLNIIDGDLGSGKNVRTELFYIEPKNAFTALYVGARYLRQVHVPYSDKELVTTSSQHRDHGYYANKIFLGKRFDLSDPMTFLYMIKCGANIHDRNDYAIQWACGEGLEQVVKYLLYLKSDITANHYHSVNLAFRFGHANILKLLLVNNNVEKYVKKHFDKLFQYALDQGHNDIIKQLILLTKNVNSVMDYRIRKIITLFNDIEFVKAVIIKGLKNIDKYFLRCITQGYLETVKYFVSVDKDIAVNNPRALVYVAETGNVEMLDYLVSVGCDLKSYASTIFRLAAERGHFDTVKYIVDNIDADIRSEYDFCLIMTAVYNHIPMARYMISLGANVDTEEGACLAEVCRDGNIVFVELLVAVGANVNACNGRALTMASRSGHMDVVKHLIASGANVSLDNYAAIRYSFEKHMDIVKFLARDMSIIELHEIIMS